MTNPKGVPAGESVVFRPAFSPGPPDNPFKGFVPYAGQGREFPRSLEFDYLSLASMMTGPTNFSWAPMERLLDSAASRGCQSVFRIYIASWLMESSTSRRMTPDERERALAAARSLGYELQVVQATAGLTGRALEASVTLTNRGVAPFYADWPVQVMAVGRHGAEAIARVPFELNRLQPGITDTRSVTLDLAELPTGEIHLFLGIPNPLKGGRPVRFANADSEPLRAGWLTLGRLRFR